MAKAGSMQPQDGPEFSREVTVDRLGEAGLEVAIEAREAERSALAARFGLRALERLVGEARIERIKGGPAVRLRVDWAADVVQSCVVTLEPVPARLEESFVLIFSPEAMPKAAGSGASAHEIFVDLGDEAEDPPEPLIGGRIDVGQALAEQLALALDPYPRKPGAVLDEAYVPKGTPEDAGSSPFAALAQRRKRKGMPPRRVN